LKLTLDTYFDDFSGEFICEKFKINEENCSEDDYEEMYDQFDSVNCVDVDDDEDQCDCVNCTLDRFTEEIYELANGQICPGCVREVLCDFLDEIVSHIIVEDVEEDGCGILN